MKDLKQQIEELDVQIAQKEKELKESEAVYRETPEYKAMQQRSVEVGKGYSQSWNLMERVDKKVRAKFLTNDNRVYWTKDSNYNRIHTNISDETLDAIKANLKFSLLRGSDIEQLVEAMINKEKAKNQEYLEAEESHKKFDKERTSLWQDARNMEKGDYKIQDQLNTLRARRNEIKFELEHPQQKVTIDKREAERSRAKTSQMIQKIMETIK